MSVLLLSAILFSQPPDTTQPVVTWEPETPEWGDTLILTYHHDASKAALKGLAPIYIHIQGETCDVERKENLSTTRYVVPDSVSFLRVVVHTVETWDRRAYIGIEVATPEGWSSPDIRMSELRRSFSFVDSYTPRDEAQRLLDSLRANPQDNSDYRFICLFGFLKLRELDSAWTILEEMNEKDRGSSSYNHALVSLGYDIHHGNVDPRAERNNTLNSWIDDELLTSEAYSISLIGLAALRWIDGNTDLSVKQQGKVLQRYVEREPDDLHARDLLVKYYLRTGDTARAEAAIDDAIELNLMNVSQKERGTFNTTSTDIILSSLMLKRGKIRAAQGRYEQALADFSFVILMKDNNKGEAFYERAKAWQTLERYKRTEGSLKKSLKAGFHQAEPMLKGIYLLNYGKEGYEEYLTRAMMPTEGDELRVAADFGFKDLDGNRGRIHDYRGKIVVMNYWGLGCGPCKAEIPWLNELVKKYDGKEVQFLAFSFDDAESQKAYLAEHPFSYTNLIPDDNGIFNSIGLASIPLPWQAIVDTEGRIRFTRIGGGEDNSDMMLIIDQLLREQKMEKQEVR